MTLSELVKELQYWETTHGTRNIVFIYLDANTKPEDLKLHESLTSSAIEIKPL